MLSQSLIILTLDEKKEENKNGVLWSQARMRIEMLFGHLVIGNLQLVIGNRQLAINNWLLAEGNAISKWTDQSFCFVSVS